MVEKICEACWRPIPEYELAKGVVTTRPHEIKSRGAGGKCIEENQFQFCVDCHRLWHDIGWIPFIEIYDHLEEKATKVLGDYEKLEDDTPMAFI